MLPIDAATHARGVAAPLQSTDALPRLGEEAPSAARQVGGLRGDPSSGQVATLEAGVQGVEEVAAQGSGRTPFDRVATVGQRGDVPTSEVPNEGGPTGREAAPGRVVQTLIGQGRLIAMHLSDQVEATAEGQAGLRPGEDVASA